MQESDLNAFKKWVKDGNGNRKVTINIGEYDNKDFLNIHVYDFNLNGGQAVRSVDEIDIEKANEADEKALLQRLQSKYGDKK